MSTLPRPSLVGIPADVSDKDGLHFHSAGDKYIRALVDCSNAMPIIIPAMDGDLDLEHLLDRLDGVLVTGATSNVHPPRFGAKPSADHEPYDQLRDALTLPLIRAALDRGMPLFCICRGFQELNVVFGGTLDTEVQKKSGHLDHRAADSDDIEVRYGPAHPIAIEPASILHSILKKSGTIVNTVHRQAIANLGSGLKVMARAPDGVIEAVTTADDNDNFVLAVQWHPEYQAKDNPDSVRLFQAFGQAMQRYTQLRERTAVSDS
ncbi:MAG: gamma-glutamyl-gamma-aminobutyrate hydrolase family protein [Anderseniella sp.]|nr:gamma-glutamyl-gamma-aminobutyrate hydrolase family protein [Anderseniella sp.]